MKILFMCVANSARSQIAEGLARHLLGERAEVRSAGSAPTRVNPYAVKVLEEIGIDASGQYSKRFVDLEAEFTAALDFVITLCAEEVCPVVVTKATRLHWPLPDPAGQSGSDEEQLARFRATRDALQEKIRSFRSR
jgi:arsenate reductase